MSQDFELVADPSIDAPFTRSWMTLENPSSASPALIALLDSQEYLSNQVSKLTEMVADLKVGPRSRRSSASSRKSGDSDVTNPIENEAVDSFIEDEDILTIFGAFVAETGHPLNYGGKFRDAAVDRIKASWDPDTLDEVIARLLSLEDHDVIRLYTGLSAQHRERKAGGKGKKSAVQTRTESFQTAIDGEDTTPHGRGEKRKAPKTPARRRQRVNPSANTIRTTMRGDFTSDLWYVT
ncbi:uncharacterized protein FFUJ_05287 [Fusarium fujikuroi IMI 58289]|uniref:Uncharacterized protein n=1 Tax=Gibberella fujikuroi (strain CBS 195.34 / IMI 58289 / NRRL A-6831) TaxID=1279085 RepID=S0DLU3_GIBF5|nr:uncharacterized protein FFUJ_05287 [Fusarium fujikuroi IMI 58289]SCN91028.1 uncharacterized protein FFE2_07180 [Fusarium fujikuroi]CCT63569.1 uncharacterized protein FFUJ_05287 [Fusarium fujikuroi IMI 58289]SCN98099.1 uncharacterized protein FFM5_06709 [Fusarium fujikuroi]SCO19638.1 uncharacterized protein FFC1_13637 [Fusarium fujikuroi]SCV46861.1 uncharacterized protein FFFS_07941 [Fusarium fujikuroi]